MVATKLATVAEGLCGASRSSASCGGVLRPNVVRRVPGINICDISEKRPDQSPFSLQTCAWVLPRHSSLQTKADKRAIRDADALEEFLRSRRDGYLVHTKHHNARLSGEIVQIRQYFLAVRAETLSYVA